jgi:uncharacterized protein (TIGR03435 family)
MPCCRTVFLAVFSSIVTLAQSGGPLAFEAASIKPADPKSEPASAASDARATLRGGPGSADPGRISYANVTFQSLLIIAYGAGCRVQGEECDQIVGPAWLRAERYDINAAVPAGTTNAQFQVMLQNLLADRFHVKVHHETRELPGYDLTVGKAAPKLKKSPADAGTSDASSSGPLVKFGAVGEYPQLLRAGFIIAPYKGTRATANHLIAREQTLPDIAKMLGTLLSTHVIDKTALTGKYDFTVDWVPEGVTMLQDQDATEITPPHGIPTALEDQLGLKLVRTRVPLDIVIVDNAEKLPTDN